MMDVLVEMGGAVPRQYLREAAARGEVDLTPAKSYQSIATTVRETGYAIFDVTGEDAKPLFLEVCKACWELSDAREWTEAQWAKNKHDMRRLSFARAAIELRLVEEVVGKEAEILYNSAGQITGMHDRKVLGKKLLVNAW